MAEAFIRGALSAGAGVEDSWSAWEFFSRLIWKRKETLPIPSIVRILLRSAMVASAARANEDQRFPLRLWQLQQRALQVGPEAGAPAARVGRVVAFGAAGEQGRQAGQALLVDREEAGELGLLAARRLDVDGEGLQQLMPGERFDEHRQGLRVRVQVLHQLHDMVEVVAEAAMRHEEGRADLAFVRPHDARAGQVDVQLQRVVGRAADHEGVALQGHGHHGRVPAGGGQEEVLAFFQAEQRDRLKAGVALHQLEDDGEVRLQLAELGRQREAGLAGIAVGRGAIGVDAQMAVGDVVEQGRDQGRHQREQDEDGPGPALGRRQPGSVGWARTVPNRNAIHPRWSAPTGRLDHA